MRSVGQDSNSESALSAPSSAISACRLWIDEGMVLRVTGGSLLLNFRAESDPSLS